MIQNTTFKLLEYPQDWGLIANDWLNLYNQCHSPCGFYHPIFIEAAQVLPPLLKPTHTVLGYKGEIPVFGLPIILKKSWGLLNQISFFGGLGFDHLAPLDNTEDFTATQEFFSYVKDNFHPAVIEGNALDLTYKELCERICSKKRFNLFIRPFFRSPYLLMPSNKEELIKYLKTRSHINIQYSVRRADKLGIEFRFLTNDNGGDKFSNAFNNLIKVHDARSHSLSRSSAFSESISKNYYELICKMANKFGNVIWFTEAIYKDEVIGSLFGFVGKHRFYFYQQGFLPKYSVFSIGRLLIYHTMLELINKNVFCFDFLRGAESYKFDWTSTSDFDFFIIMGTPFGGRVANEWLRLKRAIKRHGRFYGVRYRLFNKD